MAISTTPKSSSIKWGAILIIALMLLSGVAVFVGSQSATQEPTDTTTTEFHQYTAEEVQGTILEVFSSAIVAGDVIETDKTVIDAAIQDIENVESVSSQFAQISTTAGDRTYIANVKLKDGADKAVFVDAVNMLEYFSIPEIYFDGSIQVEADHEVLNEDNQLTRITLPITQIPAIVFAQTEQGDVITGTLAAAFQGTNMVNAYVLESQNLTASPTPISFSKEYEIVQLLPSLSVAGTVEYYPGFSAESLISDIEDLPGVEGVTIPFFPTVNNTLNVDYADANTITAELQAYVQTHAESFTTFTPYNGGFSVGLNQVNASEAKVLLTDEIGALTFQNPVVVFDAPINQFLIDMNTLSVVNGAVATALESYFASLDANASVEVYQNGFVSAETISTNDNTQTFTVPNSVISVSLSPGHSVGQSVLILVNAIALRGELAYVNGVENPSE